MKEALNKKTETKTDFKKFSGGKHKTSKENIIKYHENYVTRRYSYRNKVFKNKNVLLQI